MWRLNKGSWYDIGTQTQLSYHKGWPALKIHANQPACPLRPLCQRPNFMSPSPWLWKTIDRLQLYEIVWAKMSHQSLARACDSSMSQLALYTAHNTTYKRSCTGESYSFYNTSCCYQHLTRGCRTKDTVWLLARCLNSLHQLSAMLTRVNAWLIFSP